MSVLEFTAVAVSGVATVENAGWYAKSHQVELFGVTGSGTVTVSVRSKKSGQYGVSGKTIDLSDSAASRFVIVDGQYSGIKAASDNAADAFTLAVTPLE